MHITQPRGARGDGLMAFPRRALRLGCTKRRRDAVAESRVLFCFRSGAAVSELRDSCFHERRVAAALAQQCRTHALDVRYADAVSRRGHHGFSERPAFRSRTAHGRSLIARTTFAHAFRYRLLAATPDTAQQACVQFIAVAQHCDDALGCCSGASIHRSAETRCVGSVAPQRCGGRSKSIRNQPTAQIGGQTSQAEPRCPAC